MLIANPKSSILILILQYLLYTATLAVHKGVGIPYHLNEEANWVTSMLDIKPRSARWSSRTGSSPRWCGSVFQLSLHTRDTHPFTSFKKVMCVLSSSVSLVSFHSISKGVMGKCCRCGGYLECANISEDVIALMYKLVSIGLWPPRAGSKYR
ncbi:hypothetical protein F5148DRAFT_1148831 [Russula earlei]|uniref:Uncharacterized protein n=1 Tax=Russula earlei TaxID=71964 RepID=A0ACC0UAE5_9AGAM|nr:hypothetical protein F5148DRAFT_1148831 [Russula earlei]